MRNINPGESMDAEGLPELERRPPGIDVETEQEAIMVPRDHPVAVGDDPAYPTTLAEERAGEGVAERAARENPDAGAAELDVGGGVQGSHAFAGGGTEDETGVPRDASAARASEEAARSSRSCRTPTSTRPIPAPKRSIGSGT